MFVLIVMGMVGTPKESLTPGYAPVLRHGFRTARPRGEERVEAIVAKPIA
jgi:hypothetical protein